MAEFSLWSDQALPNHGSDSSMQVMYFQSSEAIFEAGGPILEQLEKSEMLEISEVSNSYRNYGNPKFFTGDSNKRRIFSDEPSKSKPQDMKERKSNDLKMDERKPKKADIFPTATFEPAPAPPKLPRPAEYGRKGKEDGGEGGGGSGGGGGGGGEERIIKQELRIRGIEEFLQSIFPTTWHKFFPPSRTHQPTTPTSRPKNQGDKPTSILTSDIIKGIIRPHNDRYKYAVVYGVTTEFNPRGIWVVEDFHNVSDELEN